MNTVSPENLWRVRPPWPDELDRLPDDFRALVSRRGARRHWLWVLVAGELERVVGAATLAEHDPSPGSSSPGGRLDHVLSPAWSAASDASGAPDALVALLRSALTQAETLGLARLECQATPGTPAAAWLAENGFGPRHTHEIWRVPLEANFALRHAAVERSLARRPVAVSPLDETSLPAVRAICAAHGLLAARRVVLARKGQDGLDPRLSFIAGPPEAPLAVLLARFAPRQAFLEVLARAPGSESRGPEVGALLHAFFRAALALGAEEAVCTLHAGHAPGTDRLLARAKARLQERVALFVREPAP